MMRQGHDVPQPTGVAAARHPAPGIASGAGYQLLMEWWRNRRGWCGVVLSHVVLGRKRSIPLIWCAWSGKRSTAIGALAPDPPVTRKR